MCATAHPSGSGDKRCRKDGDAKVCHGEIICLRDSSPGFGRKHTDPRRLRIYQRLPGGKILARFQALHHRRRDERDTEARHRETTAKSGIKYTNFYLLIDVAAMKQLRYHHLPILIPTIQEDLYEYKQCSNIA